MPNLHITELGSKLTEDAEQSFSSSALAERRQNEFCSPLYDGSNDFFDIPSATPNFRTELAGQLAELVPEAVADGKLDVEKLRELLTDDAADSHERFGLFWPGKKRALRAAQAPTTATLKPDLANSKDWDTTQNVFIEGDNLEVLKILQRHYHNKVKLIYIDPPYNKGKDFVYPDNYREWLDTYLEWTRQVNEEGKKVSSNSETEGRYHSNWLNMMYPRLKLARNLLADDGVIFISVDDHEQDNLKKLCNEVFGESNFLATLVWDRNRKNDAKYFSVGHEYMLVYARSISVLKEYEIIFRGEKDGVDELRSLFDKLRSNYKDDWLSIRQELLAFYRSIPDDDARAPLKRYTKVDEKGPYRDDGNINWPGGGGPTYEILHPTTNRPCKLPTSGWRYPTPARFWEEVENGKIVFGKDETTVPRVRTNIFDSFDQVMASVHYSYAQTAANEFNALFDGKRVFENPKPMGDLRRLIAYTTSKDDIILDFFAGSATTAHAVMQLNAEDNGKRRFIMVQLPEPTPEASEARKAGFATIADISRKRIELAGEKIKSDFAESQVDTGFRAYKLADTNFTKWRVTSDIEPDKLTQHLLDLRDSSTDDASLDDLLTELLLKLGYSLSEHLSTQNIAGLDIHAIAGDADKPRLLAYLNERTKPTLEQLRELVNTEPTRLIVLEDAFHGDDELKTNIAQYAGSKGIELRTA
ncbi:site-specific DNA-methyltransferase [Lonsdalea populi]|uniref:site-specific DNA-methyltransferase (adenine-specific) n=1 Tax=Lonsdalea populi TaxID=1172565 RepID=A0A3N0UTT4_9GAMM|nr:site-specific DNA-methyltransferase [Lonsdalea populi]ROH83956.1 site-specific DNA-methyltransferase [Lonsdalea populi]